MTVVIRAVWDTKFVIAPPAYLALVIWINSSALFMFLENFAKKHYYQDSAHGGRYDVIGDIADESQHMTSVPDSMYWCCIYLTGEWANVDFSFGGSRLSIAYVFFGITMFSIPVAIIVE